MAESLVEDAVGISRVDKTRSGLVAFAFCLANCATPWAQLLVARFFHKRERERARGSLVHSSERRLQDSSKATVGICIEGVFVLAHL